jgi:hypothetical protein
MHANHQFPMCIVNSISSGQQQQQQHLIEAGELSKYENYTSDS